LLFFSQHFTILFLPLVAAVFIVIVVVVIVIAIFVINPYLKSLFLLVTPKLQLSQFG
jgi:hypothetical protein